MRRRLAETKTTLSLNRNDVAALGAHRDCISRLDEKLEEELPSIKLSRRLQRENDSARHRALMVAAALPVMKSCVDAEKRNRSSYKKLEKYADRLSEATIGTSVLELMGDGGDYDDRDTTSHDDDDVLAEFVRGLHDEPTDTLRDSLGKAIDSGERLEHVIPVEKLHFPPVPLEQPVNKY
jgi:hypothetical protein